MTQEDEQSRPSRRGTRLARLRRSKRPALTIGGAVVALLVVVLLGMVGYRMFSTQLGAAKKLDSAAVLIEEADSIVVQADSVVSSDVTTGLAQAANAAAGRVPQARFQLRDALDLIGDAKEEGGARDKERAALLGEAAQARIEMLEHAPTILGLNAKASDVLPLARDGWASVLAADKTSDEAVIAYNRLTKAGVTQSSKLNKRAAQELATARDLFVKAEATFPEVAFDSYVAYVDTRMTLNRLSQQSDAAWLKKDTKGANEIITRYNALDKTGIAQAQALPASPQQAIASAYEAAAQAATAAYYEARDVATAADEALR